jgi:AcrR family transcriptional regulator
MKPDGPGGSAREAILEAAVQEFAERGYEGVRIEHVAKRAGYNKSLVYRYFGNRDHLFREALRAQFAKRSALLDRLPGEFGDMLKWWTSATLKDPTFIRMILRESLDYAGGEPIESAARSAYYERQTEMLAALRREGVVDEGFDSEMLFLALLSIVVLPAVMPQVVRLVTGESADSPGFTKRWEEFLHRFAAALAPR